MVWRGLAYLFFTIWIGGTATAAEFFVDRMDCNILHCGVARNTHIELRGTIVQGDYDRLVKILKDEGPSVNNLVLNSHGGSVSEAIRIGRLARRLLLGTIAPTSFFDGTSSCSINGKYQSSPQCVCHSSCFFIYASGIVRLGNVLGLHRPRFEEAASFGQLPAHEASKKYDAVVSQIKSYLEEVNVDSKYFDRMMRVSSANIDILKSDDYQKDFYGYIPSYSEWLKDRCGEISESERKLYSDIETYMSVKKSYDDDRRSYPPELSAFINSINDEVKSELMAKYSDYEIRTHAIRYCQAKTMYGERRVRFEQHLGWDEFADFEEMPLAKP